MYQKLIWNRVNVHQTVNTIVWAKNELAVKQVAESKFGVGNVLNGTGGTD